MVFAIKMILDIAYAGYRISLTFNVIILKASFLHNLNFKIQMLAGKSLKICVSSHINTTLVQLLIMYAATIILILKSSRYLSRKMFVTRNVHGKILLSFFT